MDKPTADEKAGRTRRIRKLVVCIAICLAVVLVFYLLREPSVKKQLAAIEAARAIPDAENAAVLYSQAIQAKQHFDTWTSDRHFSRDANPKLWGYTQGHPWTEEQYPKFAKWIEGQGQMIDKLMEASQMSQCCFPIPLGLYQPDSLVGKLDVSRIILAQAANKDTGEGRVGDALRKHLCTVRIAGHLYQQPVIQAFQRGFRIEGNGLWNLRKLVVETGLTNEQANLLEANLLPTKNSWDAIWPDIDRTERLYERKRNRKRRAQRWLRRTFSRHRGMGPSERYKWKRDRFHGEYLDMLAGRRGLHIVVALRKYKDKHGEWPLKLDDIGDMISYENLVDPTNEGSYVYRYIPSQQDFALYGKGRNNVDEGGERIWTGRQSGPEIPVKDDVMIWAPDHWTFQKEDADDE